MCGMMSGWHALISQRAMGAGRPWTLRHRRPAMVTSMFQFILLQANPIVCPIYTALVLRRKKICVLLLFHFIAP